MYYIILKLDNIKPNLIASPDASKQIWNTLSLDVLIGTFIRSRLINSRTHTRYNPRNLELQRRS